MNATSTPPYHTVTEQPGQSATGLQLSMMARRYAWARQYAAGHEVLEIACGSGTGLGILAEVARQVDAGDVDEISLVRARATYQDDDTIRLHVLDASDLPFPDSSFDVVLLFECIYYLPDPQRALEEAHRVLRPGGCLLIATVNCEWRGFNPSPFSRQYPAADELQMRLEQCGFAVEMRAGFPESRGILSLLVSSIRRIAVRLRLVPRTMNGKAFLKRIFYGGLQPIPARMSLRPFTIDPLEPVTAATDLTRYRVLYAAARRGAEVSPEI